MYMEQSPIDTWTVLVVHNEGIVMHQAEEQKSDCSTRYSVRYSSFFFSQSVSLAYVVACEILIFFPESALPKRPESTTPWLDNISASPADVTQ